jgi:hypothetical protein
LHKKPKAAVRAGVFMRTGSREEEEEEQEQETPTETGHEKGRIKVIHIYNKQKLKVC